MDQSFHCFPSLPKELRDAIWRECLPRRVVELDTLSPVNELHEICDDYTLPCCNTEHTSRINAAPPIIAQVCRESRLVAFENSHPIEDPGDWDQRIEIAKLSNAWFGQWFDPGRDTVNLYYSSNYDWEDYAHAYDNPLPYFLSKASQAQGGACLSSYFICDKRRQEWDTLNLLETQQRREYYVCEKIVCLHVDLQPALKSGLFGLLGEERIQLVDAGDHDRIRKFRNLWEASGLKKDFRTAKFFHDYVDDESEIGYGGPTVKEAQTELRDAWVADREAESDAEGILAGDGIWFLSSDGGDPDDKDVPKLHLKLDHPWVKGILSRMPAFHPAIMIRLCTRGCFDGLSSMPRFKPADEDGDYDPGWKAE